jgi:hypothetical protein
MFWGIVVFVVVGCSDKFVGVSQLGATVAASMAIFAGAFYHCHFGPQN